MLEDVPSPIDYRVMSEAREWEAAAMEKRPWRTEIFERFVSEIASSRVPVRRVLELGSGPGFLAFHVLHAIPDLSVEEQQSALRRAGFAEVELLLLKGGLVLHRAI